MATTTQRFRRGDADWTPPKTTTRITTRLSPLPKIPRDEQVRIARPLGGGVVTRRPTPLDLRLAQAKSSVRLVSNNQDQDVDCDGVETLRDPEIVDLAGAPTNARNWATRRKTCPPCPPRQPPPVPPKPRRVPPPSVASRQSEMSFGILDYYIHDPSPAQSPSLPCAGTTPVVGDTAINRFDFGLERRRDPMSTSNDANPGADDDEMQLIPLSPRPFEEHKTETPPTTNKKKKQYSLFPAVQEVTPSSNRLARVIKESPMNDHPQRAEETPCHQQEPNWRPRLLSGAKMTQVNSTTNIPTTRHRTDTISSSSPTAVTFPSPTTTIPSPSYHPHKSSRSFSINMNPNNITTRLPSGSISSGSGRGSSTTTATGRTRINSNPHHIPLRILSSSSTATTATANTTSRSSTSTSSGSTLAGQQKPLLSRWSEDTALASPTTAAHALATTGAGGAGCRASFGSLLAGDGGLRTGEVYPDCFFEDDDEDCLERPLRRMRTRDRGVGSKGGWGWLFCCGRKG